jgi:hypothetical protein
VSSGLKVVAVESKARYGRPRRSMERPRRWPSSRPRRSRGSRATLCSRPGPVRTLRRGRRPASGVKLYGPAKATWRPSPEMSASTEPEIPFAPSGAAGATYERDRVGHDPHVNVAARLGVVRAQIRRVRLKVAATPPPAPRAPPRQRRVFCFSKLSPSKFYRRPATAPARPANAAHLSARSEPHKPGRSQPSHRRPPRLPDRTITRTERSKREWPREGAGDRGGGPPRGGPTA